MTSFSNVHSNDRNLGLERLARTLVVIPALNEENHIENCVRSLLTEDMAHQGTQVIVADGGSTDATREIVRHLQTEFENLCLLDNPDKLQSAGVNRAADSASLSDIDYLVRCDAHSIYPPDFVLRVVTSLSETDAASVVVPMDAVGEGCFGKANAWIVDTPFGNGGSAHRAGKQSRYVDHGHHAGFKIDIFRKLGGYDASFSHNEDAEYDLRLAQSGEKIFLDANTRIAYVPRASARGLAKQYFNYGKGRARTTLKHHAKLKPRQMIPVVAMLACMISIAAAYWYPLALLVPASYIAVLISASAYISFTHKSVCGVYAGLASGIMHMSWALGFLKQYIVPGNKTPSEALNLPPTPLPSTVVVDQASASAKAGPKSRANSASAWRGLNRLLLMINYDLRRFAKLFATSTGPRNQAGAEEPRQHERSGSGLVALLNLFQSEQEHTNSATLAPHVSMDGQVLTNSRGVSTPLGEAIYAVGDVHGQLPLLEKLLAKIEEDRNRLPSDIKPVIVFLGDYIDRGLQSKQVIDLLLSDRLKTFETVFIAGNHEDALLTFTSDPDFGARWAEFGGGETLFSYGVNPPRQSFSDPDAWTNTWRAFRSALPSQHLEFFSSLQPYHIRGDYIFVHAGLRPGVPVANQDPQDMMWIRDRFLKDKSTFSKLVVHGHTPTAQPELDHRRLGLDTGAYSTGVLTAARLLGSEIKIIST